MDIYMAKDKLWEEIKHIFGIYSAGIGLTNGRECIVVWGRPLALRRVPDTYMGYMVRKEVVWLPPRAPEKVPRSALKMAEKISKLTNIPMEQVLKSKPLRKYIKKIREEDYILY